jgi:hypothetical protein
MVKPPDQQARSGSRRHTLSTRENHTLTFFDTIQHFSPPQVNAKSGFHVF